MKKLYRQGDVFLWPVSALPQGCVEEQKGDDRVVLAWGEVTGHNHAIERRPENGKVRIHKDPQTQCSYVEIAESLALLEHQEHATITCAPGIYEVRIQREYTPEQIRRVQD